MSCTQEIADIMKKCKVLLLDIEGTTTSISFVKDKLFPYAEENVKQFLDSKWEEDEVQACVSELRKLALEDQENSVEGAVPIPGKDASKEEQIEGLVKNVKWQMAEDRKVGALKQIQGMIWKQGYEGGDIKGHVYEDVQPALVQWKASEGRKVYIYSSGSVQAQKLLFGQSVSGDMLPLIDGHFDTAAGGKQDAASYGRILEQMGCDAADVLFLTDVIKEAEAAKAAGMEVALVSREGNAPLPESVDFPVLTSFHQISSTNKRKIDQQDEQPAKIAKTVENQDPKTLVEKSPPQESSMEVDSKDTTSGSEKTEIIVQEVTDSDSGSGSISSNEAKVEEITECKILKEDAEPKNSIAAVVTKENNDKPIEVMDIEEITDGELIDEIIEEKNVVPVVEEPADTDLAELENVGSVLEKECDEILSKVNNVTNLDNMCIKPVLKTIAEDSPEDIPDVDITESLGSETNLEQNTETLTECIENISEEIAQMRKKENCEAEKASEQSNASSPEDLKVQTSKDETIKEEVVIANETKQASDTKSINETGKSKASDSVALSVKNLSENDLKVDKDDSKEMDTKKEQNEEIRNIKEAVPEPESINDNNTRKEIEKDCLISDTEKQENVLEQNDVVDVTEKLNGSENINGNNKLNQNGGGDSTNNDHETINGGSDKTIEENGKVNGEAKKIKGSGDAGDDTKVDDISEVKVKTIPTEETPQEVVA